MIILFVIKLWLFQLNFVLQYGCTLLFSVRIIIVSVIIEDLFEIKYSWLTFWRQTCLLHSKNITFILFLHTFEDWFK